MAGEWQERKEQLKWRGLEQKEKIDVKMLVEAEERRKKMGGHKHYWRKRVKRQTNT